MNMQTSIICGEASETDSDDEGKCPSNQSQQIPVKMATNIQGAVVTGEDSESDIDLTVMEENPVETSQPNVEIEAIKESRITAKQNIYDSLLHRKLRENNTTAQRNLNNFFLVQAAEASAILSSTEQQLMRSQITLQATLNALRTLNANSQGIRSKLRDILVDAHFLDNIVPAKKC